MKIILPCLLMLGMSCHSTEYHHYETFGDVVFEHIGDGDGLNGIRITIKDINKLSPEAVIKFCTCFAKDHRDRGYSVDTVEVYDRYFDYRDWFPIKAKLLYRVRFQEISVNTPQSAGSKTAIKSIEINDAAGNLSPLPAEGGFEEYDCK